MPLSHSRLLRAKILLAAPVKNAAYERFHQHSRLAELVPLFFVRTHQIIRASVPLMERALERARALDAAGGDPLAAPLAAYLERHVEEERRHDEWLLDDLEVLGWPREQVWRQIPPAAVAEAVGAQYYWLLHDHPVAVMGYIGVLEGYPPSADEVRRLAARTGLPWDGFRTYYKHAHLDPRHRDDFDRALDALPLDPRHTALVGLSAMTTVETLARSLDQLIDRFEERQALAQAS